MSSLAGKTISGFAQLIGIMGILLFVPVGTLDFPQAWVYLFIFAASSALITVYLWKKDPKLLERRVKAGPGAEKEKSQKRIQLLASAAFIAAFILPSLDHEHMGSDFRIDIWPIFMIASHHAAQTTDRV